jgi:hypothetical protein
LTSPSLSGATPSRQVWSLGRAPRSCGRGLGDFWRGVVRIGVQSRACPFFRRAAIREWIIDDE